MKEFLFMKISVICVGYLKENYLKQAVLEYSKRLSGYCNLNIIEVDDEKSSEMAKIKEGKRIMNKISDKDFVVALDIKGENFSSEQFSELVASGNIVFVIGGSVGLSDVVLNRANKKVSFSKMTFPHQLMRVILLEQIYRGFKIFKGEPYHK